MLRFIYYGCLNWKCRNYCADEADLAKSIAKGTYSLLSKLNINGFDINKLNVVLTTLSISHPDYHQMESHNYKIINVLGSTARAKLFKCLDAVGRRIVVVKKLYLDTNVKNFNPKSEGVFLSSLSHPNIVNYTNSWEADGSFFLVMEYCEDKLIRKDKLSLNDDELKLITRQIVIGLYYLHSNHVIHSDIKPENILIDGRGKVKILDFGEAKMYTSSIATKNGNSFDLTSLTGTPCYLAPEALHHPNAGFAVDIWGLGCVLAYLVTGDRPWKHLDNEMRILYALSSTDELPYNLDNIKCSPACMEVLRACLQRNPTKRPSSVELLGFNFFLGVPQYLR
jgi:serine/threonine protein kinase